MDEDVLCACGRRERKAAGDDSCKHAAGQHWDCHPDDCGHSALGYTRLMMAIEGKLT